MTDTDSKARVGVEAPPMGIDASEYLDGPSAALAEYVEAKQISFRDALSKYDVVSAHYDPAYGSYMVMTGKTMSTIGVPAEVSIRELGYSAPSPFTAWTREEHNPKLRDKLGLREYYRMKRQDGMVRGALRMLKTPIQAGRWFVEAGSDSTRDKTVAAFVEKNLFEQLNVTWSKLLDDILLMCEYGYMPLEKVWGIDPDGKMRLKKLAARHPLDVREWLYDANGGPDGLVMEPTESSGIGRPEIFIPISKMAVFTLEAEAGDLSGISVLRSAYKHWYYKDTLYKIDAIQKERHGIGVPIIKLPPGFNDADKRLADELGRNLRTNERAHVVLPPAWEIVFAKLEGQPVDCLKSIDHHNMMIMANVLAPFINDPKVDPKSTDMFMKSTRYIALAICDVFNRYIIPELVDANFALGPTRNYPQLRVRRIGEWEDIRTMSFAFRNFVGAGAIIPDDVLETFIRQELDLPPADPETSREVGKGGAQDNPGQTPNTPEPPQPGPAEPPRQAAPTATPGKTSTGLDRSGG